MKINYKKLAEAIYCNEEANGGKCCGIVTLTTKKERVSIQYSFIDLEGYEPPCYDIESSRCGPGDYYDLEVIVFDYLLAYDDMDEEVEIDEYELSVAYTCEIYGSISDKKKRLIYNYYNNEERIFGAGGRELHPRKFER